MLIAASAWGWVLAIVVGLVLLGFVLTALDVMGKGRGR